MSDDLVSEFRGERRVVKGIHEPYQGLVDFTNIESYFEGWIKPNILGDLDTVFVGARQKWENRNPNAGEPGRGDFFMAVSLFAALEHLGAFMAEESAPITTAENIARVAKRLQSTWDVYAILANMGRNALAHGAWPQTAIAMPVEGAKAWAFGLSFNANSNPMRHDTLHVSTVKLSKLWVPDGYEGSPSPKPFVTPEQEIPLLKLVLNVQMLRWELLEFIDSGEYLRIVGGLLGTFDRVKKISTMNGIPGKEAHKARSALESPEKKMKRLCAPETVEEQINELREEFRRINPNNLLYKFPRDHRGDIKLRENKKEGS